MAHPPQRSSAEDGLSVLTVGRLPLDVTQDDLRTVFSTYGEVMSIEMKDDIDPAAKLRSALVAYSRRESASDAIEVLHSIYKIRIDAELPITVEWASSGRSAQQTRPADAGDGSQRDSRAVVTEVAQRHSGAHGTKRHCSEDGNNSNEVTSHAQGVGHKQPRTSTTQSFMDNARRRDSDHGYKAFVGGLPTECTEDELRTVFCTYGQVNKVHIMPPHASTGRVAAFVFYEHSQSVDDAIAVLNRQYKIRRDAEMPIEVKWASLKEDGTAGRGSPLISAANNFVGPCPWRTNRGAAGGGGGGGRNNSADGNGAGGDECSKSGATNTPDGWKLHIGKLPDDITQAELFEVFSTYGEVRKVHVMPVQQVNRGTAGFVFYATEQAGIDAIQVLHEKYKIRVNAPHPIQVKWGQAKGVSNDRGRGAEARRRAPSEKDKQWKSNWGGSQDDRNSNNNGNSWTSQSWSSWNSGGWHENTTDWKGSAQHEAAGGVGGGGSERNHREGGDKNASCLDTKLFVSNLPTDVYEDALRYVFGTYGRVMSACLLPGGDGSVSAFVEFSNKEDADTAIRTLNNLYEMKPGCGKIIVKRATDGDGPGIGGSGSPQYQYRPQ